jgi:UDP-N-acetylglucosamine 2-epimerase (non-hydrolysing)
MKIARTRTAASLAAEHLWAQPREWRQSGRKHLEHGVQDVIEIEHSGRVAGGLHCGTDVEACCRIVQVAGTRPNFIKIAPIARAFAREPAVFSSTLVHTGQHYDAEMSDVYFDQLGIPRPAFNLLAGSGSEARQTAAVMTGFEEVLLKTQPDLVLVVGDVNSTLACALVAARLGVPIAHVDAGLRSFDRSMPEEINRVLTDQISDWLFVTEPGAEANLAREGIDPARVHFVGNVMIDTLLSWRERARRLGIPAALGLGSSPYAVLTLHRPHNVDQRDVFEQIMQALEHISRDLPIVFPMHPRTRETLLGSHGAAALLDSGRLRLVKPLGYLEFLGLIERSRAVLTDSADVQEETTVLGVPCLTLRPNTERPATVNEGTNRVVGTSTHRIIEAWEAIKASPPPVGRRPKLWDGRAAERIVEILRRDFEGETVPHGFDRVPESLTTRYRQTAGGAHGVDRAYHGGMALRPN